MKKITFNYIYHLFYAFINNNKARSFLDEESNWNQKLTIVNMFNEIEVEEAAIFVEEDILLETNLLTNFI